MRKKIIRIEETGSTNSYLRGYKQGKDEEMTVVIADFQTGGRGQGCNKWESERGKNLLFSILVHPHGIPVNRQFIISEAVALSVSDTLKNYSDGIKVKWPNDIYHHDRKICGILIENNVSSKGIENCIIGIGININQREFHSDAPNPVSLFNIIGSETPLNEVADEVLRNFEQRIAEMENNSWKKIRNDYMESLYRREGFHTYRDENGIFDAEIINVEDDGHITMRDGCGNERKYAFKEVEFILHPH